MVRCQPGGADGPEDPDALQDGGEDAHLRASEAVNDVDVPGAVQRAWARRHRLVGDSCFDGFGIHRLQQSPIVSCTLSQVDGQVRGGMIVPRWFFCKATLAAWRELSRAAGPARL